MISYLLVVDKYRSQIVFFFKQKTAYEMRISDWSSDVCSSDLSSFDPANIEVYARAMALPGRTRGGMEWYRALAADHAAALAYKKQPLEMPVLALGGD